MPLRYRAIAEVLFGAKRIPEIGSSFGPSAAKRFVNSVEPVEAP